MPAVSRVRLVTRSKASGIWTCKTTLMFQALWNFNNYETPATAKFKSTFRREQFEFLMKPSQASHSSLNENGPIGGKQLDAGSSNMCDVQQCLLDPAFCPETPILWADLMLTAWTSQHDLPARCAHHSLTTSSTALILLHRCQLQRF